MSLTSRAWACYDYGQMTIFFQQKHEMPMPFHLTDIMVYITLMYITMCLNTIITINLCYLSIYLLL